MKSPLGLSLGEDTWAQLKPGPKVLAVIYANSTKEGAHFSKLDPDLHQNMRALGIVLMRVYEQGWDEYAQALIRQDCETAEEALFIRQRAFDGDWPYPKNQARRGGVCEIEVHLE